MIGSSAPLVSVLVLNHNGREHLQTCLPTLATQTYPRDRLRIEAALTGLVVDLRDVESSAPDGRPVSR